MIKNINLNTSNINLVRYLDVFNKYGFFDSEELKSCFLELNLELFPLSKPYIGGYLNREISNDISLFIANMSRDAMIILYQDSTFFCDENTQKNISFANRSLKNILSDLDKYSIKKNKKMREGIFYFNHETGLESMISFRPGLEIVKLDSFFINERKARTYTIDCNNATQKMIEVLTSDKF